MRQTPGFDPFSVLSSFQSNVPQLEAIVDRTKAKQQGVALTDLFETLQIYLGSAYVNDFNLLGRTYTVYAQADAQFRDEVSDIQRLKVRNALGEMVPIGGLVTVKQGYGPDPVVRFNGYPAADVSGGADPALMSSAEVLQTASRIATETLPSGMTFEWSGLSYQQVNQGNAALLVYPLCVLFVFLVLAALYESWSLPLAVILIVPLCLLSAIGGTWLINLVHGLWLGIFGATAPPSFLDNNIFTQVGLVVLMGLACKNAILIVEFARELEHQGRDTIAAALEACRLRLRPILMTSFAFIMGVLPLVFASGAGAEIRYVMGLTVFLGMLGVTFFGLFLTPVFYVLLRRFATRKARRAAKLRGGGGGAGETSMSEPSAVVNAARPLAVAAIVATLLAGCAIGPDYQPPATPLPAGFAQARGAGLDAAAPAASEVWKSFAEPELDALIARAQQREPQHRAGERAARRGARDRRPHHLGAAALGARRGEPRTQRAERPRSVPAVGPGRRRRPIAPASMPRGRSTCSVAPVAPPRRPAATSTARVADQAAVRLSTTAEVAQAWFALRGAEARLAILRRNLENLREDLRILESRREAGRGTELDTSRQAHAGRRRRRAAAAVRGRGGAPGAAARGADRDVRRGAARADGSRPSRRSRSRRRW